MRYRVAATLLLLFAACSAEGGPTRAEVLSTPFPGTILTARAMGGDCSSDGCLFDYRVKITNPTDRAANVQECMLGEPLRMRLPVIGVAGLLIQAHAVRAVTVRWVLPTAKETERALVGQRISCVGLDWHGNPPD